MRRDLWNITRAMTDSEFESEIAELRTSRALIAGDIAYERAMDRATFGLSTARAIAASETTRNKLMDDYLKAGLSDARIRQLMMAIPV
jgi:hypothetical protein